MSNPKITIVTICYNTVSEIARTMISVLEQNYSNFEYIIIDGASTDGTIDEIMRIKKEYISRDIVFLSEKDNGIYNAMNKGIDRATGEWIIFMNSGDCFVDRKCIGSSVPLLSDDIDMLTGEGITLVNGLVTGVRRTYKRYTVQTFLVNSLCHQATFIKTTLMKSLKYDENLRIVSDWKFCIEALIKKDAVIKPVKKAICCFDHTGISNSNNDIVEKEHEIVLNELIPRAFRIDYDYNNRKSSVYVFIRRLRNWYYRHYDRLLSSIIYRNKIEF